MNKVVLILGAVAVCVIAFLYWLADQRGQTIVKLKTEIKSVQQDLRGCEDAIKQASEAEAEADKQISEIKTIVKTVKSDCNCYDSPIDDAILGRVRGK